jgi:hypothetical protein
MTSLRWPPVSGLYCVASHGVLNVCRIPHVENIVLDVGVLHLNGVWIYVSNESIRPGLWNQNTGSESKIRLEVKTAPDRPTPPCYC